MAARDANEAAKDANNVEWRSRPACEGREEGTRMRPFRHFVVGAAAALLVISSLGDGRAWA